MLWAPGRTHGARKQIQAGSRDHQRPSRAVGTRVVLSCPPSLQSLSHTKIGIWALTKNWNTSAEEKKETEFVTWKRNSSEAKGQTWAMSHGVWIGEGTWGAFRERVNTFRTRLSVAHWWESAKEQEGKFSPQHNVWENNYYTFFR